MSMQSIGKHDNNGRLVQPTYKDGRTKQSFKDETDINKILHRAQKAGTMSHLEKYQGTYGDFAEFDFLEANLQLTKGREVFDALPSEIRNEFKGSPAAFFDYVNDPKNINDLTKKLPMLAAPGRQNIDLSGKTPPDEELAPQAADLPADASPPPAKPDTPTEDKTAPPGAESTPTT